MRPGVPPYAPTAMRQIIPISIQLSITGLFQHALPLAAWVLACYDIRQAECWGRLPFFIPFVGQCSLERSKCLCNLLFVVLPQFTDSESRKWCQQSTKTCSTQYSTRAGTSYTCFRILPKTCLAAQHEPFTIIRFVIRPPHYNRAGWPAPTHACEPPFYGPPPQSLSFCSPMTAARARTCPITPDHD